MSILALWYVCDKIIFLPDIDWFYVLVTIQILWINIFHNICMDNVFSEIVTRAYWSSIRGALGIKLWSFDSGEIN